MQFLPADYVIGGITLVMSVLGLFRGFSGTLAFVIAVAAAVLAAGFGWTYSATLVAETWMRVGGTLVGTLLVFGIVRMLVKKLVNGLLAQPTDAILGFLIGASCGGLLILAWATSGMYLEYSALATELAAYVR